MSVSKYDIELDLKKNPGSSHALIVAMVGANKRVLDVGCDTGYLGEALNAFGNRMVGFDISESSAEVARTRYERVEVGDLEGSDLREVFPEKFDVIVLADVLEHLRDPLPTLRDARSMLEPGGSIVISVPNVAHGDLRLNLLRGKWNYTEVGLLDDTHTRFFTRDSLVEFVRSAGFTVLDLQRTRQPLFATEVGLQRSDFDPAVVAALENDVEATTYQFVLRAVPATADDVADEQALLVDSLRSEVEEARRVADVERHENLRLADELLGATVSAEQLARQLRAAEKQLAGVVASLEKRTKERDSARRRLEAIRTSTSWRLGSALVKPAARLKRPQ